MQQRALGFYAGGPFCVSGEEARESWWVGLVGGFVGDRSFGAGLVESGGEGKNIQIMQD